MRSKNVPNEYEQARIKRMQENKRMLEELGLEDSAAKLFKKPTKPALHRFKAPKEACGERRRSSRVAALPAFNYQEKEAVDFRGNRRCRSLGAGPRRGCVSSAAIEEACKTAERIERTFPSIVKQMMPSHVAGGFWLGLPRAFCVEHLPREDTFMTLVDEDGLQWQSLYLYHKNGLSGGWRGFALDHNLEHGDAVVFELVKRTTFQMHIVRVAEHEATRTQIGDKASSSRTQPRKKKTGTRFVDVPVKPRPSANRTTQVVADARVSRRPAAKNSNADKFTIDDDTDVENESETSSEDEDTDDSDVELDDGDDELDDEDVDEELQERGEDINQKQKQTGGRVNRRPAAKKSKAKTFTRDKDAQVEDVSEDVSETSSEDEDTDYGDGDEYVDEDQKQENVRRKPNQETVNVKPVVNLGTKKEICRALRESKPEKQDAEDKEECLIAQERPKKPQAVRRLTTALKSRKPHQRNLESLRISGSKLFKKRKV